MRPRWSPTPSGGCSSEPKRCPAEGPTSHGQPRGGAQWRPTLLPGHRAAAGCGGWSARPMGCGSRGCPFARPGARFTRDFEQLVAWLAIKMDKDAVRRLVSVGWATVGRICQRVVADELDPGRLDGPTPSREPGRDPARPHQRTTRRPQPARPAHPPPRVRVAACLALVMLSAGPMGLPQPRLTPRLTRQGRTGCHRAEDLSARVQA